MKGSKLEFLYLILSIIILIGAGIFYKSATTSKEVAVKPKVTQTSSSSSSSSTEDTEKTITTLKAKINELMKKPNQNDIDRLKKEVEALKDSNEKDTLLKNLTDMEADLKIIKDVEENLNLAETTGLATYLEEAQAGINKIKATTSKKELQERLDKLTENLTAQLQNQATEITEAKAESEVETVIQETSSSSLYQESSATTTYTEDTNTYYQYEVNYTTPQQETDTYYQPVTEQPVVEPTPAIDNSQVYDTSESYPSSSEQ